MSAAPPAAPVATDLLATALVGLLGPWGAVAALAYKFGVPFVTTLFQNAATGTDPTPAEWASLTASISIPGETLVPKRPVVTP
jgi:hypothetical protein